jgi:hypothetical protein
MMNQNENDDVLLKFVVAGGHTHRTETIETTFFQRCSLK